jgi:putative redox protein
VPRRYKAVTLNFRIAGKGIEKDQVLRAIDLAATKYCSVRDSLRSDIAVAWTVELHEESTGTH